MPILFQDRRDAGRQLGSLIAPQVTAEAVFLGIPRGGVPIADELSRHCQRPVGLMAVRKLPIPDNPEMGFGAVGPSGVVALNTAVMAWAGISEAAAAAVRTAVLEEIRRRLAVYDHQPANLAGRSARLVDDGLATGYTMLAAIRECHALHAASVQVAAPVCHAEARARVQQEAPVYCLHTDYGYSFAVASFYARFPDLEDNEVVQALATARAEARALPDMAP